jgi:hypothetical protein
MMAVTRWPSYSSGFFFLKLSSGKSGTEHCCGLHECPRQGVVPHVVQEDAVPRMTAQTPCDELPHYLSLLLCPRYNGSHSQPAKRSLPPTRTSQSNLISRRNFSLQVLEHCQMHLDYHAGEDSNVLIIVPGQNRVQESLLDVQQLLVTDDLTLNIGDVKALA